MACRAPAVVSLRPAGHRRRLPYGCTSKATCVQAPIAPRACTHFSR